jgi:FkbH-like protein
LDFALDQARIAPVAAVSQLYTLRGFEFVQALWAELVALYRTVRQIDAVKLVIVDLDDTLWRGVAAEMEDYPPEMIEGWPLGFAETLCTLRRRGTLLAIVSKNHKTKIANLWDPLFQGRLSLEDFAVKRINWEPKGENVEAVIREVNVLPSSVVFIDDNPVERAAVQSAIPGIRVLGANQYYLRRVLLWAPEMQVPLVTEESARRTELIKANSAREDTRKRLSRAEFLATLDLKVRLIEVGEVAHKSFPRTFELINKTNQFNTTGKRWTQEEFLIGFAAGLRVTSFEVEDRFSKHGLVGVVITQSGCIEQVVMSCRVVGLDVEIAVVGEVVRRLRAKGLGIVTGRLVETRANLLCRNLFERCGFTVGTDGIWLLKGGTDVPQPPHVGGLGEAIQQVAVA